jgi:long-chain acyl-CoA synthetase
VSERARQRPQHAALLFKGATIGYGALEHLSDAFACGLQALGVEPGDRVGLVLPNCPQFVIAELAAWKIGAIVVPLNPLYAEAELQSALNDTGTQTVVVLTRLYHRMKHIQPHTKVRQVVATNIKEHFPPLLRLLFTIARERRDGDRIRRLPGDHGFRALVRSHQGRAPRRPAVSPDDTATLLLSGGTTGTPKSVVGTHGAYVMAGLQIEAWTRSALEAGKDVIMLPLPLFHVYGNVGVQSLAFITGCPMALVPNPRDLADLIATIRRVRPAFFNGVPTLYAGLLNRPEVRAGRIDFRSIKICFSGAAPLMAETKRRFESLTGGRIVEGYSLTEAMMALCVNPVTGPNKIGSVGMPLPDVDVRIVDQEEGARELAAGEVGEVCFAAPQLMAGFWNRPEETSKVIRVQEGDGARPWLHTGDLGYLDEDGYLFIVDRQKDLIKTSGYQVWPREIEEVLSEHPSVAEVGVVGVHDDLKGETVHAFVVLRAGQEVSEADLRAFCRDKLAPYKVPSKIEFRHELPKSMVGKVLRRALKA